MSVREVLSSVGSKQTVTTVYHTASDRDVTLLAAGFAYYAFVALLPLVLLAIVVGSLLGGQEIAESVVRFAGNLLPTGGEELIESALTAETGRGPATVLAVLVGSWAAYKVFRGLSRAFDSVYAARRDTSFFTRLRDGIAVTLGVVGALVLMFVLGAIIGALRGTVPYVSLLAWLALLLGLVAVFLPIYYVLPPIPVTVGEILPGTFFAAVGWTILQYGFQIYAASAGQYQAYGAVGALLLFVTWLYFAGIIIHLGAVINVVLSRPERTPAS